ncbi:MAG TPA: DUF1465 family protein [Candidatus Cybelea sp.]|nr:DUF1465 family protein [Candidatus Cybelea sp.]
MQGTAFFGRTYEETLALVTDARDYLRDRGTLDAASLDPLTKLAYSAETSRVTARLTHLMAWLLLQRAVHQGEITAVEACREAPELARVEICTGEVCIEAERLPARLNLLLARSERLYTRIMRLDQMIRRDAIAS